MATKILYIVSTLRDSGPTNQLFYLIDNLRDKFSATIITLSPEPEDSELSRFNELDIEYRTLGLSRLKGALLGPSKLRSVISRHEPDIIHSQGFRADTLSALFLSKYPRVTTIRNYAYDDYPAKFGPIQGETMARIHLYLLKRIDYPVACSETIADKIASHGIDTTPIQNGVDTTAFVPADDTMKSELRENLKLPQSKKIFISVGSLIPRKNPKRLINGFLSTDMADESELVFLGDGFLRDECEAMVGEEDPVRFEGWVNNVSEYLQASDYFVSASKSEGLPNSVMEAMAVGLPVCLSNIEQHDEILQYGECSGVQFDCCSSTSLASSIEKLTSLNYDLSSETARQISREKLSAKQMAQKYQREYNKLNKK